MSKRIKLFILCVGCDLILMAAIIATYAFVKHSRNKTPTKPDFAAEIRKAQVITSTQGK